MKNRRRRKIKRTPPPWKSAIGVALLAHGLVIAAIVVLGWRQFATERPGSAIFVNDVVIGEGEGGNTATSSPPLKVRGGGGSYASEGNSGNPSSADAKALADRRPPLNVRGGEQLSEGNSSTGASGDGASMGSGSISGGAGNPILAEIRRRIEQSKRYPNRAREQHIEGRVGVQFVIQSNGQVHDVRVTRSSGTPVLDEAAIQAVRHSTPLPYYGNPIDLSLAFRLR